MPRSSDSDLTKDANRGGAETATITLRSFVDCAQCGTTNEAEFDTGAHDEDGLADIGDGDLEVIVVCVGCGRDFPVEYAGWMSYGEA